MNGLGEVASLAAEIRQSVKTQGWAWVPDFQPHDDGGIRLLELAATLGKVCVVGHNGSSFVKTKCDYNAPVWEPFNRPEAIGWHNDFSTWAERPVLSIAWVCSHPPDSESRGDWRVVACSDVIASLEATSAGRRSLALLRQDLLPFVFAPNEPVLHFHVLDATANTRARFYGRALRLGLAKEPNRQASEAIDEWERTADMLGRRLTSVQGALLVCDNWRSMHDRLEQAPGRSSGLVFIADEDAVSNLAVGRKDRNCESTKEIESCNSGEVSTPIMERPNSTGAK